VVLIRDIPFFSTAEDSLLPFYGRCHVGYVPAGGSIVGRDLHSFPIQLNLSSSVHRVTQLSSWTCPGVAQVEL